MPARIERSNPVRLDESWNGATVHLQVSQTLLVALREHTTTGELWQVEEYKEAMLLSGGDWYDPRPDGAVGAENVHVFSWTATQPGLTGLRYRLTRVSDETIALFRCGVRVMAGR
jgi:predicted secreted protein